MKTKHRVAAHAKRQHHVNLNAHSDLIEKHREPAAEPVMEIVKRLNECFQHLRNGGTSHERFDTLAAAINVGWIRAEKIDPMAVQTFILAVDAMQACGTRFATHRRYGFGGVELQDMQAAIDLYAQILALSTPAQMNAALMESVDRMIQQAREQAA